MKTKSWQDWWEYPLTKWRQYGVTENNFCEREFQVTQAYRAERQIRSGLDESGEMQKLAFVTIDEVDAYIQKITQYAWFRARWGVVQIRVCPPTRQQARSWCYGNYRAKRIVISQEKWSMNKIVVLHELAHVITPPETGAMHGRYWARTFLELLQFGISKEIADTMKAAFKQHKVKYVPKKVLSPEVREAAQKRFLKNLAEWKSTSNQ